MLVTSAFSLQKCWHIPFEHTESFVICPFYILDIPSQLGNLQIGFFPFDEKCKVLMKPSISTSFPFVVCAFDTISKKSPSPVSHAPVSFQRYTVGLSCWVLTPSLPLHMVQAKCSPSLFWQTLSFPHWMLLHSCWKPFGHMCQGWLWCLLFCPSVYLYQDWSWD